MPEPTPTGDPVTPGPQPQLPREPKFIPSPGPDPLKPLIGPVTFQSAPRRHDAIGPIRPSARQTPVPPAADVAPLQRRIEDLEKKLLSLGAMNLVLATVLKQRRLLDDDEFASVVMSATRIHEKGQPSNFEELLQWAKAKH